jgi:hypothetical protein
MKYVAEVNAIKELSDKVYKNITELKERIDKMEADNEKPVEVPVEPIKKPSMFDSIKTYFREKL